MMHRCSTLALLGAILWAAPVAAIDFKALDLSPAPLIPVETFAQQSQYAGATLSPDGTHIAFSLGIDGRRHVIVHPLGDKARPVAIPPINRADIAWFRWANDDRLLIAYSFKAKRGWSDTNETRLIAVNADGSDVEAIVKPAKRSSSAARLSEEMPPAQIQTNVIDFLPDEPHHILLSIDDDLDGNAEIRRIDIRNGDYKTLHNGHQGIQNWLVDQHGTPRFGWGFHNSERRAVYRAPDGRWRNAEKAAWYEAGFRLFEFTNDPTIAYATGTGSTGREQVVKIDLEASEVIDVIADSDRVDVNTMVYDPVSRRPIGAAWYDKHEDYLIFDPRWAAMYRGIDAALPETDNDIISISADYRLALVRQASDVEPGAYYLWDRASKEISYFAEAMPGLSPDNLAPMEAVSYRARDGLTIAAYLTIPRGSSGKNLPTVILPHGGPQARDYWGFNPIVQFLANRGYAVLQPNFRGSTGYGHAFEASGRKQWGGTMQDDLTDGTRWLIEQGIADPSRICIAGISYGGYASLMGPIKEPTLYACAVSINGVLNLPGLIRNDKNFIGGSAWVKSMGLDGEKSKAVSPHHRAADMSVPVLIIHARDDARIPYKQARAMERRLKKAKKPVDFVTLEDGGHSLINETAMRTTLTALERFLDRHIGPYTNAH